VIIVVLGVLAVLTVPLTGGDLRRLSTIPIRHAWAIWVALGVQTALVWAPDALPDGVARAAHLGTYAVAGWFAWSNRHLPGVWLMALGGALNLIAIVANGGVMPASPSAWERAGYSLEDGFANSQVRANAPLGFLGDVFAVPDGWPFANVFSVGDIVIVIGIGWLAHRWCRRPDADPQPSASAGDAGVPAESVVADVPEDETMRRSDRPGE
jgi:Family of unknown function (DUF5317)